MEYYHQILAAHLLVVIVFGSGLLLNASMLPAFAKEGAANDRQASELRRLHAWTMFATSPALCLVWLIGASLAFKGGWFDALWLQMKLSFVAAVTVLHGLQVFWIGQLRRGRTPRGISRWHILVVAVLLLLIAILAGGKPA